MANSEMRCLLPEALRRSGHSPTAIRSTAGRPEHVLSHSVKSVELKERRFQKASLSREAASHVSSTRYRSHAFRFRSRNITAALRPYSPSMSSPSRYQTIGVSHGHADPFGLPGCPQLRWILLRSANIRKHGARAASFAALNAGKCVVRRPKRVPYRLKESISFCSGHCTSPGIQSVARATTNPDGTRLRKFRSEIRSAMICGLLRNIPSTAKSRKPKPGLVGRVGAEPTVSFRRRIMRPHQNYIESRCCVIFRSANILD
jgi:hypothetical protein